VAEAVEFLSELVRAEPWNWQAREKLGALGKDVAQLSVVAKSTDAAYATRVEAARAIRNLKGPALTGTEPELIAISAGVTDYAHPYWVAARVDAGTEKSLKEAVAIEPRTPKLALFRAALGARHDAFAIAVARQMAPYLSEEYAEGFLSEMALADRVEVARGMAAAYQRVGNLREAAAMYEVAQKLSPDDATRRALAAVRTRIELDAKNAARRPVVSKELEQDRLVHARLTR